MARTEVQEANEAVLAAVDDWLASRDPSSAGSGRYVDACGALHLAAEARRKAIARQDVREREVYLRSDASAEEREAAQAAMISRGGWRGLVFHLLAMRGAAADVTLEHWCSGQASNYGLRPEAAKHQTISSARKSLVDCGLVRADGAVIINGRRHMLWTLTTDGRRHATGLPS
jgi:hypothetical protein